MNFSKFLPLSPGKPVGSWMRRNCSRQSGLMGVLWQHVLPVRVSLYIAHKEVLLHPE